MRTEVFEVSISPHFEHRSYVGKKEARHTQNETQQNTQTPTASQYNPCYSGVFFHYTSGPQIHGGICAGIWGYGGGGDEGGGDEGKGDEELRDGLNFGREWVVW